MGDPNKSIFDNMYNAIYVDPPYGGPGNNVHNPVRPASPPPSLPPIQPPLPRGPEPFRPNVLDRRPIGRQIMDQQNPFPRP